MRVPPWFVVLGSAASALLLTMTVLRLWWGVVLWIGLWLGYVVAYLRGA